ncbi:hypothetical protein PMIN02_011483 [Paraphaeosphaeria minitans]
MLIRLAGLEQRLYEANARSLRGRHFRAGARIADLLVVLDPPAVLESAPTHVESQTIWMRLKRENPPANLRRTNILVMDMKIVPRELVAARECPAILIGSSQTGSFRLRYEAVGTVMRWARLLGKNVLRYSCRPATTFPLMTQVSRTLVLLSARFEPTEHNSFIELSGTIFTSDTAARPLCDNSIICANLPAHQESRKPDVG